MREGLWQMTGDFLSLATVALAALTMAWSAPEPVSSSSTSQPDTQNVCVTGQLKWLLIAAAGPDVCQDKDEDMVVHIHKVAEIRAGTDKYELYDYDYNFQAAVARHGGSWLLVVKDGKYVGRYEEAAGGLWRVSGAVATVLWTDTKLEGTRNFSKGVPHTILGRYGYTFLQ